MRLDGPVTPLPEALTMRLPILLAPCCGIALAVSGTGPVASQEIAGPPASATSVALDYAQASARLREVSDAVQAAEANVRNKQELEVAAHRLRIPEVSAEIRRLELQKTLTLPLGSLAPVAQEFGLPSRLEFVERDWHTRPILTATLPLYTGGLIPAAQGAAAAAVRQADAEREAQTQSQSTQLVQAYFGQQLARQVMQVRSQVRDGLQRHLLDAQALEREGFASRAQRLQAQVARDKAEREYQKSSNDLVAISTALSTLLRAGGPVQASTPLFVNRQMPASLAQFQMRAQDGQPQLEKMRAMVEQAEHGVRVQQAALKPTIYAFGQYDMKRRDALITDPDWVYGVGVKYTLLSGQSRLHRISAAREQQSQAEAGLREARNQVTMGVARAWQDLDSARQQYLLLASSIAQAEENLRLQELSFREAQATSLDVIDARLALGAALVERAQAAYEYDVGLARLLELSGQAGRFAEFIPAAEKVEYP